MSSSTSDLLLASDDIVLTGGLIIEAPFLKFTHNTIKNNYIYGNIIEVTYMTNVEINGNRYENNIDAVVESRNYNNWLLPENTSTYQEELGD